MVLKHQAALVGPALLAAQSRSRAAQEWEEF